MRSLSVIGIALLAPSVSSFAFLAKQLNVGTFQSQQLQSTSTARQVRGTSLKMVDDAVIQGAAIGVAGLVAGIGLVAFTEQQGERAKQRGGGLSDSMSTKIAGGLLEDVEVSSIDDVGSLTSQLEKALREAKGLDDEELVISEETKKRVAEEADDGW